jgi:hypothetical protein
VFDASTTVAQQRYISALRDTLTRVDELGIDSDQDGEVTLETVSACWSVLLDAHRRRRYLQKQAWSAI